MSTPKHHASNDLLPATYRVTSQVTVDGKKQRQVVELSEEEAKNFNVKDFPSPKFEDVKLERIQRREDGKIAVKEDITPKPEEKKAEAEEKKVSKGDAKGGGKAASGKS